MFSKATTNFVRQVDPEGILIPVSRVNDSKKLVPMALVVKRNRAWFWQRPKYHPTDFTLSNLLQGDEALHPGVSEEVFVTYKGTYEDKISGKLDTEASSISVILEGGVSSKLQSSFGTLKKEELVVSKLLQDSKDRQVDMGHTLVQQLKKRDLVLAVVKERIITTSSCAITMIKKDQCITRGVLGIMGLLGKSTKVHVKENTDVEVDSDVSLEIPPGTVIAYSILELVIRKDGQYVVCLHPATIGGIEADSQEMSSSWDNAVDGDCQLETLPLGTLLSASLEKDLHGLEELPKSTRCALFKGLQDIMADRSALACLQSVLEDLCSGKSPDVAEQDGLSESQRGAVSAVLNQLGLVDPVEESLTCSPAHLNAAHLLVSALEELLDDALTLLSGSTPEFLEAFEKLMSSLKDGAEPLTVQSLPVLLQQNQNFQLAEQLLTTSSVTIRRDANRLQVETGSKAGIHTLHLYLSVYGLVLLAKC